MALVALPAGDLTTQLSKALTGNDLGGASAFIPPDRQTRLRDQLKTYYSSGAGLDILSNLHRYLKRESP